MGKIRNEFMEEHLLTALYYGKCRDEFRRVEDELQEQYRRLNSAQSNEEIRGELFNFYDGLETLRGSEAELRYEQGFRRGMQLMIECLYFGD